MLGIAGPHARDVLAKLTSSDMSHKGFPFMSNKSIELADVPVRALRISYTGLCNPMNITPSELLADWSRGTFHQFLNQSDMV